MNSQFLKLRSAANRFLATFFSENKRVLCLPVLALILVPTGQAFSGSQHRSQLIEVDTAPTTNNIVTAFAYNSRNHNLLFSGGDGGYFDVYEISSGGELTHLNTYELYDKKGPSRGIIASQIGDKEFVFVGNKRGNAIEVFELKTDASLHRVHVEHDSEVTHLGVLITLRVIHMKDASYLYAGGLESDPGLSCFKINSDGSLVHVQSMKDNEVIHTDGIIAMHSHVVDGKTYLITGGFQDNGISSFKLHESGQFENIDNFADNKTDRYLTGTYPVDGVTLGKDHYVVVGHRHHKYYKRLNFIKQKDFVYHGDGVSVFKIDATGKIQPHFVLKDDEQTKLGGQTRIEILKRSDQEAIVTVATRDDNSIQICKLDQNGILHPTGVLDTNYPIYYGMASLEIDGQLYFFAGSVDNELKTIHSYRFEE